MNSAVHIGEMDEEDHCVNLSSDSTNPALPQTWGLLRSGVSENDAKGEVSRSCGLLFWFPALSSEPRYPSLLEIAVGYILG